jgi:hypothetical protein
VDAAFVGIDLPGDDPALNPGTLHGGMLDQSGIEDEARQSKSSEGQVGLENSTI